MRLISRSVIVFGLVFAQAAVAQTPTPGAGGTGGAGGAAASTGAAAGGTGGTGAAGSGNENTAKTPAMPAAPVEPVTGNKTGTAGGAAAPLPAAPAPAGTPLVPTVTPAPASPQKPGGASGADQGGQGAGIGLSPTMPTLGGGTTISSKEAESLTPSTSGAADEWKFDFHGYLRAPLRISFGPPTPAQQPSIYSATPDPRPAGSYYAPTMQPSPSGIQWHSPTRVPGYLYTTWEYTNTVSGPWTQLNFTYGNSRVMATVIVDAYNQTDGSYRNIQANQGIDQAFITLNFPDVFGDYGGLVWNVGTFQNRYGTAGKYDGGMYETYLFGRTHQTGETLTANFSNIDAAGDWAISVEHGIGAKMDIVPFLNNPNYKVFQNIPIGGNNGSPYLSDRSPDFLPYSGTVPMGSTFIHHAHIGAKYQKLLTFGAHYLFAWTPDDNWSPINSSVVDASDLVPRAKGPIPGSISVVGGEVKFSGGYLGDGYLGYSHIDARNINALADIIEVLHSYGGYQFKQNFFGQTFNQHTGVYTGPENETGTVDNLSAQYSFSFGAYNRYPEDFWGDGPDLVLTGFLLLSVVNSPAPPTALPAHAHDWDMSTKKLKFGFDALYTPLYWLGVGGRFDMVQPDLDAAYARTAGNPGGSQLNFEVATARLVFKTQFVTHETVTLMYQHYWLGSGAYPPYPYQWLPKADSNLLSIYATMWW
jgi:hypothetical protein